MTDEAKTGERHDVVKPMTGAERARAYRRRRKDGLVPVTVDVFEVEISLLEQLKFIPPGQGSNRISVGNGVTLVLDRAMRALAAGTLPP
ncbi:MAG: hypothetical protein ACLQJR_05230 [Stellaceae bacterium]